MFRLTYFELIKTFFKKRTYLGFLVILVVVPIVEVAMKVEGGRFIQNTTRALQRDFFFVGNLFNGWFISYTIMMSLFVHVPLLITFVSGDQLAGEATGGTYRLILTRPVSRSIIFLSKFAATLIYTFVFVAFLALFSIGLALALLGPGELMIPEQRGILILESSDVAWRFLVAYAFAFWSMTTISSLAFFFSSFVENAIGPIVAAGGLLIVMMVLTFLPVEALEPVKPFMFTKHMNLWQLAFGSPLDWVAIKEGVTTHGVYTVVSVCAAWLIFVRKDILS